VRIAVLGATGVLGRLVVQRLAQRGHKVVAVARDVTRVREVANVRAMQGDILDPVSLERGVAGCQAVLHLATAIPKPGGVSNWAANDRVRIDGTRNLLAAARAHAVERYVQQSVAMVLTGPRDALLDDAEPRALSPVLASAVEMERMVAESPLDWVILRGGAFYGPGTGRIEEWTRRARGGNLVLPGDGGDYVSLVHVEDMADVVVLATLLPRGKVTLNVVDDRPVEYRELFEYVASVNGARVAGDGAPCLLPSFRVSNARTKTVLGWQPRYPDYRAGGLWA
jgi:nucleoside-diphosphate-sugar epimerase